MNRALWPPSESQAKILGEAPPCPICGGDTYWDEVWDLVFIACCVDNVLHLGAHAHVDEGLKVYAHNKRKRRRK